MNWIIELWGAVTPDAHLSAFVAVFVVIATAVTAAVFKLVVYIFKRLTKEDTSPSPLGNNNVVLNGSSSNSGGLPRDPIDSGVISNLLDQINQLKVTDTEKNTQIKDLHQTVDELTLISKGQGDIAHMAKEALIRLANSHEATNVTLATDLKSITENYENQRMRDDRIAAQLYRGRGALAYANNTHESLGHYQRATQLDPNNVEGWNQLGHLHQRLGELEQAMKDYKNVNDLATEPAHRAVSYGNMGIIFQTQGDLEQAMTMYQKALDINTDLGHKEGMANQYGNMGLVFKTQGDLEQAMAMYQKALDINIDLGRKEGMATQYSNMGNVFQTQGDLKQAMAMYQKALDINIDLGRKEGMAYNYANMGIVFQTQGDLEQARDLWQRALVLFTELGSPHAKTVQSWLDSLKNSK